MGRPGARKDRPRVHHSWEWGIRQITNSKRPILSPDDVKGLKILTTPPAMAYQAAIEALGGNVQTIASATCHGHAPGVVDGQRTPSASSTT